MYIRLFFSQFLCILSECFYFFLDVRIATDDRGTSKRGLANLLRRKQTTIDEWEQMWIRNEADEDGYFLLQIEKQSWHTEDMFLTAKDASSLTIESK